MHIIVCVKQIIDPEIPSGEFKVDFEAKKAEEEQGELVMNPYDDNAVEVALQLKDKDPDTRVTALTMGGETTQKVLRRALAMGCNEAIWLKDPLFEGLDSAGTARVLAQGIKKADAVDIVLCGRQAGDWDMSQVGFLLAEELGSACIPLAFDIQFQDGQLLVKRETDIGMETLKVGTPMLATVTNASTNQPRFASVKGVLMAGRKQIPTYGAQDLGFTEAIPRQVVVEALSLPDYERQVEIIDGEDGPEKAVKLVEHLVKMNLLM